MKPERNRRRHCWLCLLVAGWLAGTAQAQSISSLYSFTIGPAYPQAALVRGPDGNFYGTTYGGGSGAGTVFRVTTNGALTTLVNFNYDNGAEPEASLTLGPDGNFYGTTCGGGTSYYDYGDYGTVFRMTTNGVLTTLVRFNYANGGYPGAALTLGPDGIFYGTTESGGSTNSAGPYGNGSVFKVTTNGTLTTLVRFNYANGGYPSAALTLGPDGNFYGTTQSGGSSGDGTVFRVTTNGALTTLVNFNSTNGANPYAGLTLALDGNFYGTTCQGGSGSYGTVFRMTANGAMTTLVNFTGGNDGGSPFAGLTLGLDGNFYGITADGGNTNLNSGYGSLFKVTTNGVLTTLLNFNYDNGAEPEASLTLAPDGNFYGTTYGGDIVGNGTVFRVTTNGALTTLVDFTPANGENPYAGLTLGPDGDFYGATLLGGNSSDGTMFRMATNGILTTLVNSNNADFADRASLTLGPDGDFYGTTTYGGSNHDGTVFRMTTDRALTSLVNFTSANGAYPQASLTLGPDGNFYGTTQSGGSSNDGTLFQVTTNGALTTLVNFTGDNGANPYAGLTLGPDGIFYGTTAYGGSSYYDYGGYGTVFRVTTNGALTTLVNFNITNGAGPQANLTLGPDGNFYGTTSWGGSNSDGTVFRVTTNGAFTTLVNFNRANGARPSAGLTLGPDGNFYGTTVEGGNSILNVVSGYGSVFKVTTNGALTTLVNFTGDNGANPYAGLTLGPDGNFYGTTEAGGNCGVGSIYRLNLSPDLAVPGTNNVVFQGNNAVATITPFGSPPFTCEWLSNDLALTAGPANTFTISNTTLEALADYQVIIFNDYGNYALNLGDLNVIQSPLLDSQPQDETLPIGSPAVFKGPASGVLPLAYQWYFNSAPLSGATNASLLVRPALTNEIGTYQLVVTNLYGSITSRLASLNVLLQPNSYAVSNSAGGQPAILLGSYPHSTNRLWATTNLLLPLAQWRVIATNVTDGNGLSQFLDTNTEGINVKYYRLSLP